MTSKNTKERDQTFRDSQAKLFHDLAKLTFGGMVIGGAMAFKDGNQDSITWSYVAVGIIGTVLFATIGNRFIKH